MMPVNGLYGHIQRNNAKAVILVSSFLFLFMMLQASFRIIPVVFGHSPLMSSMGILAVPASERGAARSAGGSRFSDHVATVRPMGGSHDVNGLFMSGPKVSHPAPRAAAPLSPAAPATPGAETEAAAESDADRLVRGLGSLQVFDKEALFLVWFAAAYLLISTWWNGLYIRYATRARPLERREFPQLYNLVENLAMTAGLPCPAIELIDSPSLNAYASGLTPGTARLGLTTGLIQKLDSRELEAVIAHELTHIRYGDSRLMAVTKSCVDLVVARPMEMFENARKAPLISGFLLFYVYLALGAAVLVALGLVVTAIVLITFLVKAMVLHTREFVADAGAIELTKNPAALIAALRKISGHDELALSNPTLQAIMFSSSVEGLFSTHPSLDDRIAAIREHAHVNHLHEFEHCPQWCPPGAARPPGRALVRSPPPAGARTGRLRCVGGCRPSGLRQ